jgi:SAM-dependent methyltransferase
MEKKFHHNIPSNPEKNREVFGFEKILSALYEKSHHEQTVILEKAIGTGTLPFSQATQIFDKVNSFSTKLAVIESLPKLKRPGEIKKCINFLKHIAIRCPSFPRMTGVYSITSSLERENILKKYSRFTDQDNYESDMLSIAAIQSLGQFGQEAEETLLSIVDENRDEYREDKLYWQQVYLDLYLDHEKKNFPNEDLFDPEDKVNYVDTTLSEKEIIERDNEIRHKKGGFVLDEQGIYRYIDDKQHTDRWYFLNAEALNALVRIGSRKSVDFVIDFLKSDPDSLLIYFHEIKRIITDVDKDYAAEKIFESIADKSHIRVSAFRLILTLTDLIGAEETRNRLNNLLHKERGKKENANQKTIDNLEYARAFITPNHEKIAVESLPDLYENKIKFETYGLNDKMQKKEVELLKNLIPLDQKVLEVGMGTGRLFLEMEKAGYDITGYDFVNRHVALVKGESPEARVFKGDWKNNALKDEGFDVVFSLGRNILHEYSLPDQMQMFREAARVLKKGGRLVFDIPNREKGEYRRRVLDYAETMHDFGVHNFRYGAIYDSPDGMNFTTRYAYSQEDIENLARLTGFRILEVRRAELPTGKGDENLYYVLEKI